MSDTDSSDYEFQYISELVPDLLRRILPVQPTDHHRRNPEVLHAPCHNGVRGAAVSLEVAETAAAVETREQAAEDLCDFVATRSYAQIAVRCMAFQILAEVAIHDMNSGHHRMAELCVGALANITCHEQLAEQVLLCCTLHSELRVKSLLSTHVNAGSIAAGPHTSCYETVADSNQQSLLGRNFEVFNCSR